MLANTQRHLVEILSLALRYIATYLCVPVEEPRNRMKVVCQHQQQAFIEYGVYFLAVLANQLTDRALKLWLQHSAPQ